MDLNLISSENIDITICHLRDYVGFEFPEIDCRIYTKGFLYIHDEMPDIMNWLKPICEKYESNDPPAFSRFLSDTFKETSGKFSIILAFNNDIFIISDVLRAYPVFYSYQNRKLLLTGCVYDLKQITPNLKLNYNSLYELMNSGIIFGSNTAFEGIYGIQAAEILHFSSNKVISTRYFQFRPDIEEMKDPDKVLQNVDEILLKIFKRLIKNNPGVRKWVIPLSGGHDSRCIANYLFRLGVKNVLCYSYGTPGNSQSVISKQVAEVLGFEWHFVEYTPEKWKELHDTGIIEEYFYYAATNVAIIHLQDFLAVYELKKKGILKGGDIFLPGHTTVTETEFHHNNLKLKKKDEALRMVYNRWKSIKGTKESIRRLYSSLSSLFDDVNCEPRYFAAVTDWQERQSKYVVNSVSAYDFFGFSSRLPLYERDFMDFWLNVPACMKINKEPFYQSMKRYGHVKELVNTPFTNELQRKRKQKLYILIKKLIPDLLVKALLHVTRRKPKLNEGLNLVFASGSSTVRDMIEPVSDFPDELKPLIKEYLDRYTYQMDYHILSTLYTIRKLLDFNKKQVEQL